MFDGRLTSHFRKSSGLNAIKAYFDFFTLLIQIHFDEG